MMKKGIIKFYNQEKGYGFIKDESGHEYFFHISNVNVPEGMVPSKGDPVEFLDIVVKKKGYEAKAVTVKKGVVDHE